MNVSDNYQKLRQISLEGLEIQLPEKVPALNQEVQFERPYSAIYLEDQKHGTLVFNGEILSLYLPGMHHAKYPFQTERYLLSLQANLSDEARCVPRAIREHERKVFLAEFYKNLPSIIDQNDYFKGICGLEYYQPDGSFHEDYTAQGVTHGELKQGGEGEVFQAFYTPKNYPKCDGDHFPEITALRRLNRETSACFVKEPSSPCFHVHKLSLQGKLLLTLGLCNAIKLKERFSECSIIEAYEFSHINSLISYFENRLYAHSIFVVLPEAYLKELEEEQGSNIASSVCKMHNPLNVRFMPINLDQIGG